MLHKAVHGELPALAKRREMLSHKRATDDSCDTIGGGGWDLEHAPRPRRKRHLNPARRTPRKECTCSNPSASTIQHQPLPTRCPHPIGVALVECTWNDNLGVQSMAHARGRRCPVDLHDTPVAESHSAGHDLEANNVSPLQRPIWTKVGESDATLQEGGGSTNIMTTRTRRKQKQEVCRHAAQDSIQATEEQANDAQCCIML